MSLSFDSELFSSIEGIPEKLRDQELYPKVAAMLDHIVQGVAKEFEDVKFKYRDSQRVSEDVIKEIITEYGYDYIRGIMDTITNFEFNTLLGFISLINILKGSRQGLELVLRLLGFESAIREWWEQTPKRTPHTFEIIVALDQSNVPNIFQTLAKVETFTRAYVYPIIENIDFKFNLSFGERPIMIAGFFHATYQGTILARIP